MHPAPPRELEMAEGRQGAESRVYSLCFFGRGDLVPDVTLIEAESDAEAIDVARASRLFTTREVWDRHRLVAVIPPAVSAAA